MTLHFHVLTPALGIWHNSYTRCMPMERTVSFPFVGAYDHPDGCNPVR